MSQPADPFPRHPLLDRARHWQLRTRRLALAEAPLLMGIVNVTPDSFSDGAHYRAPEAAVARALELVEAGADLIDIGGESTRPYATPVDTAEELRRVLPVVERLCAATPLPISIDTSKSAVARAALAAGAEVINDVTGLTGDPQMVHLAAATGAAVCAMHMQGTPRTMQDAPRYGDVVSEVMAYLELRRSALVQAGIAPERIALDPGIGFGKTHRHNLELMAHCWQLHRLGCPVLVGHSRKGFLAKVSDDRSAERTASTIGGALALAAQGVQIIRVHDVAAVRQALQVFVACGGVDGKPHGCEPQ